MLLVFKTKTYVGHAEVMHVVNCSVANKRWYRYRIAICDALFNALRYKVNFVSQ